MPPPPGINPTPVSTKPDVRFRRSLNSCAMQADFASAAERHALRRDDDRFRRVLDGEIRVLKLLDREVQLVPLLLLRGDQHEHQIRAHGKIHGLVGDDHGVEIRVEPLQSLVEHGDQIRADRVHLRVKFAADHAVAKVDQARAGVAIDFAARVFQRFENDDALAALRAVLAAPLATSKTVVLPFSDS